jgi:hypothetical protein
MRYSRVGFRSVSLLHSLGFERRERIRVSRVQVVPVRTTPSTCPELPVTTDLHTDLVNRDSILKLLSDNEVARVSKAETAEKLAYGEEYVDLGQPTRGVQHANGTGANMGDVLPRKAVGDQTWSKILTHLMNRHSANTP